MSTARRADGRWIVKYKGLNGLWKQKSFKDEGEARAFDERMRLRRREEGLTLGEAMVLYVQNHELCDTTLATFSYVINGRDRKDGTHAVGPAEHLATKYVHALNRRDIEGVRQALREAGLKPVTINTYVAKIRAAVRWAAEEELVPNNPLSNIRSLPVRKEPMAVLSMEDFQTLHDRLPSWAQWACRTCFALCLRPGNQELSDLEWSAFDWQACCAHVHMPKVGATKTVYMPDWYLDEARERFLADSEAGRRHVVHGARSERMNYHSFGAIWARASKETGITLRPYDMRHLSASAMLAGGADIAAVAAQLGHRSVHTTANFYLHVMEGAQRKAGEALEALLMSMTR